MKNKYLFLSQPFQNENSHKLLLDSSTVCTPGSAPAFKSLYLHLRGKQGRRGGSVSLAAMSLEGKSDIFSKD